MVDGVIDMKLMNIIYQISNMHIRYILLWPGYFMFDSVNLSKSQWYKLCFDNV